MLIVKVLDAAYRPFIEKVGRLAEALGKSRVHGAADAINFIKNLDYEQVSSRLFNKNKSEFLKFFAKEFPEQMAVLQGYQKSAMREAATIQGEFSPRRLFTSINKLEPEIQRAIFSADELAKLKDMDKYLASFPKRHNPSGTAGAINLRDAFTPGKRVMTELHDAGMEKFIKNFGASPEAGDARMLGMAAAKGLKMTDKAIDAIMSGTKAMPAAILPISAHKEKLAKLIAGYQSNPDALLDANDNNPVPEYAVAFSATSSRVMQYLNTVRPDTDPKSPLDNRLPPNSADRAKYDNALAIAQQPLVVLDKISRGVLTANDVQAIQAMYPALYTSLKQKVVEGITEMSMKGKQVPYATRMQLSLFLGQPLDSSMTPQGIMGAQMIGGPGAQAQQQQMPPQAPGKKLTAASASGLNKMAKTYQTQMQARQASKLGRK